MSGVYLIHLIDGLGNLMNSLSAIQIFEECP